MSCFFFFFKHSFLCLFDYKLLFSIGKLSSFSESARALFGKKRERWRKTERDGDRQKERQTDRQSDNKTDRPTKTERQTDREKVIGGGTDRPTE